MKLKIILALVVMGASLVWQAGAQIYDTNNVFVQTFAGSGFYGYLDGQGTQTMFNTPLAVVADTQSNLFVLDEFNYRIRKITPDGAVTTFAGGGTGGLPGYGTNVSLATLSFYSMTIDHSNTLWVTVASGGFGILRIGSDGYMTLTNLPSVSAYGGLCVDSGNNIYYSTYSGNKIYRWKTNGVLEVFAGSGNPGSADGNGIFTTFYYPAALAADAADNIYVWDSGNHLIRRINQNRDVETLAGRTTFSGDVDGVGTNATFNSVSDLRCDNAGNLIMACNASIRKMSAATNVTTIAGSFSGAGYTNGTGNLARFNGASGVCVSQGIMFVADSLNHRIRSIAFDPVPQVVAGANLGIAAYAGVKITGVVGRAYRIESSMDTSTWATETTILLTSSPYLWFDQNGLEQKKFYRAFLLP